MKLLLRSIEAEEPRPVAPGFKAGWGLKLLLPLLPLRAFRGRTRLQGRVGIETIVVTECGRDVVGRTRLQGRVGIETWACVTQLISSLLVAPGFKAGWGLKPVASLEFAQRVVSHPASRPGGD